MSGCSASSSPSLVPFAVQTGAKAPGLSPTAPEFTAETGDTTLKCRNCGAGFTAGAVGIGDECRECGQPREMEYPARKIRATRQGLLSVEIVEKVLEQNS